MQERQLMDLAKTFQQRGIVKGGELVLSVNDAMDFAEALKEIGVAIMGVDGWYYVDAEKKYLAQNLAVDFTVDETILRQKSTAVENSISLVKEYLETCGPFSLVSFTLDIPPSLDLFSKT